MRDKITDTVDTARPYVERLARDEDLHDHVKKAYDSARKIYDELIGPVGATGVAMRVAKDKDLQDELRKVVDELREAGRHARGEESHTGRNMTLLTLGIALGILFNPVSGAQTRKWLSDNLFGSSDEFTYQGGGSGNNS